MSANHFSGLLLKGETILWSGRPAQGIRLMIQDLFLIPFSIIWCGFVIFWETLVIKGAAPFFFPLFGLPFVAVGLFLLFGRFLLDAWVRSKTNYAVTDKRILISRSVPWPSFTALQLDRLPEVSVSKGTHASGTIRFGAQGSLLGGGYRGFSFWMPALDPTPQFLGIDNVTRVYACIQQQLQGKR